MSADPVLILASTSPRRRELMDLTGIPYEVDAPRVDEACSLPAKETVGVLACRKASAAKKAHPDRPVLAADTLVAIDGHALGKPADEQEAFRMLRSLSGRAHQVYTGVCVIAADGRVFSDIDTSEVVFDEMTDEDILSYIKTGEPMDKAGSYALQGMAGMWVSEVRGSPSGIIGLPMRMTRRLLAEAGIRPFKS